MSTTKFNTCYNFAIFALSTYECYACLFAKARNAYGLIFFSGVELTQTQLKSGIGKAKENNEYQKK